MSEMDAAFAPEMAVLHPDSTTKPFWDACRERQLVYPECASCATVRMPPASVCPKCGSSPLTWKSATGLGTVYSFTIARHSFHVKVDDFLPYVIAVIALDDAPVRLISNVLFASPEDMHVGLPVSVVWDEAKPGVVIPRFRPRSRSGQ
jgi:uncharacterized protein